MPKFGDRIKETTDSTGTGTVDLNGAPTGFNPFSSAFSSSDDEISYLIVDDPDDPTDWEVGKGTFTTGSPNTFARDTVEKSSNSDNPVSFSAGTKTIIATPTAADLASVFGSSAWGQKSAAVRAVTANDSQVAADNGKLIAADASGNSPATLTYTLLAEATAGDGFAVTVRNTGASGTVDIDDDAASLIITLQAGEAVELRCDGSAWHLVGDYDKRAAGSWALKSALVRAITSDDSQVAADDGKLIDADASGNSPAALTYTLLAEATAGDGFVVTVQNTGASGTVDVDDDAAALVITLQPGEEVTLRCDGSAWQFASPPAADYEFVSTAAITAVSALTVTGLAAGYDYLIQLEAFAPTDDAEVLWMRFSDDGGSTYEADSGDYAWGGTDAGSNAGSTSDTKIALSLTGTFGNDANNQSLFGITLVNPNAAGERTMAKWDGVKQNTAATPELNSVTGGATFTQGTDAVDAVQFLWSGGSTFKAQGDISVWRRKRS